MRKSKCVSDSNNNKSKNTVSTLYFIILYYRAVLYILFTLYSVRSTLVKVKQGNQVSALPYQSPAFLLQKITQYWQRDRFFREGTGTISCALPASLQHKQWAGFKSQSGNVRSVVCSWKPDKRLGS